MRKLKSIAAAIALGTSVLPGTIHAEVALFELDQVRLAPSPFYHAQQKNIEYLLAMDANRLLAPFRREAGIANVVESYGNWENTGLDGHIGGHYMTALSLAWAASGDERIRQRLDFYFGELKKVQQKIGTGYMGGVPAGAAMWQDIHEGKIDADLFSLNKKWVPLYNIHKIFAATRDAYLYGDIPAAKDMMIAYADWLAWLVKDLSDEQLQLMLRSEHGGFNEVLVDVAEISGDQRYLDLAERFSHRLILESLIESKDQLTGLHANTQIPKVIGFLRYGQVAGDADWKAASDFFWQQVTGQRSVSMGGNSVREHFHPSDNFSSMMDNIEGPETCNTYNMLKLTSLLYTGSENPAYLDYYERATYNHILSSQHPEHGGLVYFTPMVPGHYRMYSSVHDSMWCCVGSGIENHSLYGKMIYARDDDDLLVNMIIPSQLDWSEQGFAISIESEFPDRDSVSLTVDRSSGEYREIAMRKPEWLENAVVSIQINGENTELTSEREGYWSIERRWRKGDHVTIQFEIAPRLEQLPDQSNYFSVLYGPVVLANKVRLQGDDQLSFVADDSRMGHIASGPTCPVEKVPMMVGEPEDFLKGLKRVPGDSLEFTATKTVTTIQDGVKVENLIPFFRVHDSRYQVYWPQFSGNDYQLYLSLLEENDRRAKALKAATIDQINSGEQQPEVEHDFASGASNAGYNAGKHWRDSTEWFSYYLRDPQAEATALRITYFVGDRGRNFSIWFNGEKLSDVVLPVKEINNGDAFYEIDYPISEALIKRSKDGRHLLKFVAGDRSVAGGIYGIRLLRD